MGRAMTVGTVALFLMLFSTGGPAQAMGMRPTHAPAGPLPEQYSVAGFELPADAAAFANYGKWEHSKLPAFLQLFHCSGMALFARQVFNWATFDPSQPRLTTADYRKLLKKIYGVPTATLPGARPRLVIPGFANWNELTREPELVSVVKDILGDAIWDIKRRNWNWSPLDVFRTSYRSRTLIELNLRETLSRDRVAMIYLTRGFKEAHAVLAYGYQVLGDRVRYTIYDSNHPDGPFQMDFLFAQARFDHPDQGLRDPWILHPYADEFTSTRSYLSTLE